MKISYWDCEYAECEDYWDVKYGQTWIYTCTHPNNEERYCHLENKWFNAIDNCKLLDKENEINK